MPRPDRPDSRWGYVSNMFVREDHRNGGSERSLPFYRRAGFIVPDEAGRDDRLLVRPRRS